MSDVPDAARMLTEAAKRHDKVAAWQAVGQLLPWLGDLRNAVEPKAAFGLVRSGAANNRWFDIAELLAGAVSARADATAALRRLHAQMLMERGFQDEALARFETLRGDRSLTDFDRGELFGHLGRIHKDRFIAASTAGDANAARQHLAHAVEAYQTGYREQPARVWLGINLAALLARDEARASNRSAPAEAQELARAILAEVSRRDPQFADFYSHATAAEAHLALGDMAATLEQLREYVRHPRVNSFALGATLRQFREMWQLDRRPPPGPAMIELLRAALMDKQDGTLDMSGHEIREARALASARSLEAVFGTDRFDSIENYRRGLERSACVARIGRSAETGVGTGFVVQGNLLSDKLGERSVLVTNAHVISAREAERQANAVHPSEAVVTFAVLDDVAPTKEFGVSRVLLFRPPDDLDVTVAELTEPVSPRVALPVSAVLPTRGSEAQVRVIGHPSGRGLSFSSGRFLDHQAPKVHYRAATEGGSSGGPVFSHEWRLIGVHHAGGEAMPKLNGEAGTYEANEGIWVQAIREAMGQELTRG
jgi:S1-C subfamily serine protease